MARSIIQALMTADKNMSKMFDLSCAAERDYEHTMRATPRDRDAIAQLHRRAAQRRSRWHQARARAGQLLHRARLGDYRTSQ